MDEHMDEQVSIDFNIWKDLFSHLLHHKKQFAFLVCFMVLLAITDSIFPLFNKYAIDNFIANGSTDGMLTFVLLYLLAVLMISFTVFIFIRQAGYLEMRLAHDIREKGFIRLQELPLSYYDNKAVGWLMARMTSDITRLSEIISWGLVDIAWGSTMMIAITIIMFTLNAKMAMLVLTVIPVLFVVSMYFQKRILRAQRKVRKINSKITGSFNEDIQGAKTTKTLVREELNLMEFSELTSSMKRSTIRAAVLSSIYLPLVILIGSFATAMALSYGGSLLVQDVIQYGTLVAFISYTVQLFEPIRQIAVIISELQTAQASAERVFSLISEKPAIFDSAEVIEKYGTIFDPKEDKWPEIEGKVEFKNVSFHYNEDEPVLKDFSLTVNPGQTIALVGETGSGKSTIVNLFCRFYEPVRGEILIDGMNYKSLPINWLHKNLGYVLQAPHLFSGTIKENIRYGKLDATDEEIVKACKLVDAHEFIVEMEKGYDSEVGEGGSMLSTGQKQLISFARAIVREPRLFVLDEATSSIDTETEQKIQDAISKALENRTSFVIAHRLSTIKNADRILVIQKGKVIEDGSHKELLKQKGYYFRLYTNQFMEEESKSILG